MTCKECNSRNPVGNKFCRECGAKTAPPEGSLAAEEAARAESDRRAARGAVLLADAHLLADQGKYIGAIPIALEAVATLPFSPSAYGLLVALYEHTDQFDKAVVAQEKVVMLLPNAPAEATRLERLKRGEHTSSPPGKPVSAGTVPTLRGAGLPGTTPFTLPNWFPVAAGMVAGGFALFVGFVAMTPGGAFIPRHPRAAPGVVATPDPSPDASVPVNAVAAPPPAPDVARGMDPFVPLDATRRQLQAQAAQGAAGAGATAGRAPALPAALAAAPLPQAKALPGAGRVKTAPLFVPAEIIKVSKESLGGDASLPPIVAAPPGTNRGVSAGSGTMSGGFGDGERVAAVPPTGATGAVPPVTAPSSRPSGYMRITVSPRGPRSGVAASATSGPVPKTVPTPAPDMDGAPLERARVLQGLGRYPDAVTAYREAIAAGASVADSQQAIALCYQRAGDSGSAKVAYIQAIAAYKARIATGRNPGAAQRGLNTCEAALGVLGGN